MILEKIKLFVYKIFPSIKKYKLERINKYLESFGLEKYILNFICPVRTFVNTRNCTSFQY